MGTKPVVDSLCDICGNSVVHRVYGKMMEKAFGVALVITLLLILTIGDRY